MNKDQDQEHNTKSPSIRIPSLIKGNDSTLPIPKDSSVPFTIPSKFHGPVITYSFEVKNPQLELVAVNKVEFDGKDLKVNVLNLSGADIKEVTVIGWELPL